MQLLRKALDAFQARGLAGVVQAGRQRLFPARARGLALCAQAVAGRRGLEIGGPSGHFQPRGLLPLYARVGDLDNCNFAPRTLWKDQHDEGRTFHYAPGRPPGRQFIAEATDLKAVADRAYDFVLTSHALEHSANPLRALREIDRVLKPSGLLVLVLPHRLGTFDHRRPLTTLAHLVEDASQGTTEHDLTHLPEILALHDLSLDPGAGGRAAFEARSALNHENRGLHHHVFDARLAAQMVDHAGFELLEVEYVAPMDIVVVARKPQGPGAVDNRRLLEAARAG
jgi:SAM-dependent methyltransferase